MKINNSRWRTSDEMEYLDGIGTHRHNFDKATSVVAATEKARLLRGALVAYSLRCKWGSIDPGSVRSHAERLLALYEERRVVSLIVPATDSLMGGQL